MIDRNKINDFVIKVFNYYNGRINLINNNAILDINQCNLIGGDIGGYSVLPNIVKINPLVVIRFYKTENMIKAGLIETIIHELYHTDQIINYQLYMADYNYKNFIEHSCQLQTAIYIAGHMQEINNIFGVNFMDTIDYHKYIESWYYPGVNYERRYFHDHIFMCIDNLCNFNKDISKSIYDFVVDTIKNKKSIIININDKVLKVCMNGIMIPIDDFNKYMSTYHNYTGSWDCNYHIYDANNGDLYININLKACTNIMCKKI